MTTTTPVAREQTRAQTRARYPDEEGYVERDGVVTVGGSGVGVPLLRKVLAAYPHARAQVPGLRNHFEQQFHVAHRLDRYRAGRRMDYAAATPETIAEAIATELERPVDYRPVPGDGAARAAALIAELL